VGPAGVREFCGLDDAGKSLPLALSQNDRTEASRSARLRAAMSQLGMSARAFHRILKLARTIADLEGVAEIKTHHLPEAMQYLISIKETCMNKPRTLMIPILLLLAFLVAVTSLNAEGPTSLGRAAYRQFLPIVQRGYRPPQPCLPRYGEYELILRVNESDNTQEAFPTAADLNGDGLEDVVIRRLKYLTYETFELDILLNDGRGGMVLATSSVFSGTVPAVQNPSEVIVADFNGDGRPDIFVADHGYDDWPHPGYQNTLVLSTPNGRLVDATDNLPQQYDFTHSAAAADIDADGDIDLYTGNTWGQNDINPQILLNDGSGKFAVAEQRLPILTDLNQNGYTACRFCDVNNDGSPDLILGDADDDIPGEHSTRTSEVLLNDGTGVFAPLHGAMPAKDFSPYDMAHDIEPIDLNGDDYVDLFIEHKKRQQEVSYIQVLINNQDGTFRNETALRLGSFDRQVWLPELELRDFDRDGDLDLLAMPWDADSPDPLLFLNDGHGYFGWEPFDFGLHGGDLYYTFLDLDGDGGHDIVLTLNFPPEYVYARRDLGCRTGGVAAQ